MANLNLAKFKKVQSDKGCTTLKHSDGHELRVAHASLSPALKKELEGLPLHAADGADTEALPEEPMDAVVSQPDEAPYQSAPAPEAQPTQTPEQQYLQSYNDTKAAHAKEFGEQDALYDQDVKNGHIKPETIHSLFAKKDTLGKIGTIFGLMISGAGSGLTGQPNAALAGMNQQIQNDLAAQIQSKTNAQNYYKLNLQRIKQEQAEIPEAQARSRLSDAQAKAAAFTASNLQMNRNAFHHIVQVSQGLPDKSMSQQQAAAMLPVLAGEVNNANLGIADRGASAIASMATIGQPTSNAGGPINDGKVNQLLRQSQQHLPGAPSESDMGNITRESGAVKSAEAMRAAYNDSFDKLDKLALAGKLSPNMRKAEVNALGAQLSRFTAGRFSPGEMAAQMDGQFPVSTDWHATRKEKRLKGNQIFDTEEANTPTLDRYNLKNKPDQGASGQDTVERVDPKSGKTVIYDAKTKKPLRWK